MQGEIRGLRSCRAPVPGYAATGVCWLSTAAIFRQPSIRRNFICPLRSIPEGGPPFVVMKQAEGGKPNRARATNLAATAACILSKITTVIRQYLPMAPTLVRAPFHRVGWIYEEKVDGYRMLAYKGRRPRPTCE